MKPWIAPAATVALSAVFLGVVSAAAPAEAETQPTARMVVVKNVAGQLGTGYRCVVTSSGGVDCDWDTPVKVQVHRP